MSQYTVLELPLSGDKKLWLRESSIEAVVEHNDDACHISTTSGHRYDVYMSAARVLAMWDGAVRNMGEKLVPTP